MQLVENLARNLINFERKVIHDAQEKTHCQKINNHIFSFHKKLFEERLQNDSKNLLEFLKRYPNSKKKVNF